MMKVLRNMMWMVIRPRRCARELVEAGDIGSALWVVAGFGLVTALLFLRSHLLHDYPPPPEVLQLWIDTWGEFAMLPFVDIAADHYRLFLALIMLPFAFAIWILMAGTARLLGQLLGGRAGFTAYLSLYGHSFFAFWTVGFLLDMAYSGLLGPWQLPALRGEYGGSVQAFYTYFPSVEWTLALTLGGVYNGIVTHAVEAYAPWKSMLVALMTLAWPIVLVSLLLR